VVDTPEQCSPMAGGGQICGSASYELPGSSGPNPGTGSGDGQPLPADSAGPRNHEGEREGRGDRSEFDDAVLTAGVLLNVGPYSTRTSIEPSLRRGFKMLTSGPGAMLLTLGGTGAALLALGGGGGAAAGGAGVLATVAVAATGVGAVLIAATAIGAVTIAVLQASKAGGSRFTPEQESLVEMAKGDKASGGVTAEDMAAYKELNSEAAENGFTEPNATVRDRFGVKNSHGAQGTPILINLPQ
jgi:hypothetical protein